MAAIEAFFLDGWGARASLYRSVLAPQRMLVATTDQRSLAAGATAGRPTLFAAPARTLTATTGARTITSTAPPRPADVAAVGRTARPTGPFLTANDGTTLLVDATGAFLVVLFDGDWLPVTAVARAATSSTPTRPATVTTSPAATPATPTRPTTVKAGP